MTAADRSVSSTRSALRALLAGEALVGEDVGAAFAGAGEVLGEAALARRVREQGAAVVVAREPSPTLLRALRERPPGLLVITGPELPVGLASRTLGPAAQLVIEAGELVIVGPDAAALAGLRAAFLAAGAKPRLSLCPAPAWLPEWLAAPELAGCRTAGMVPAASLHAGWARWASAAGARQVVVPLGVEAPRVDQPRHASLGQAAAAHALERLTGPVFPSPGVLALLVDAESMSPGTGPKGHVSEGMSEEASPAAALWRQARRALPLQGDEHGMEAPHPGLRLRGPANATTDAFLAQRALLRRERAEALVRATEGEAAPSIDPAALARAEEVLRSAGQALSEHESKVVLRGFGIEVTRQAVASSASGAAQFAEQIGFPVVLKAVSPDLRRKQELGAVVLDLTTSAAVRRAYATIVSNVEERAPTAHLDGVLVAEQIGEGLEIHCGAVALQSGETALFGRALAGHQEVVLRLSPLDPAEAMLFAQAIVAGVPLRRKDDPGLRELAGLLLRLDALVRHFGAASADSEGRLELVDLSPVRLCAGPRGYVTLDARIVQRAHLEGL
ncbi:acetate--CoA ligase family protein [Nannocystis sp. ILAH1]|uniref:acetate--CoA ligase family protein n=1 Tax=Nannocystis sp. ILAH1 TaxID=2996789 RepID=UPI002270B136|nr:acetate--CoA ligase family protein [Nannocystis sp. ILAH1]